jgi:hypothetical protein
MSVKLAKSSILPTDRPIPWTSRAKFMEIGREKHLNGNLRDCIAAYRDLSPDRKGMAMIISDALVPTCRGYPAVRKLEPRDMNCLLEAFQADGGGTDDDALAATEPAELPV